jgi:hypothetical protein
MFLWSIARPASKGDNRHLCHLLAHCPVNVVSSTSQPLYRPPRRVARTALLFSFYFFSNRLSHIGLWTISLAFSHRDINTGIALRIKGVQITLQTSLPLSAGLDLRRCVCMWDTPCSKHRFSSQKRVQSSEIRCLEIPWKLASVSVEFLSLGLLFGPKDQLGEAGGCMRPQIQHADWSMLLFPSEPPFR